MESSTIGQLIEEKVHQLQDVESIIRNPETSEKILDEALRERQQVKAEIDELITLRLHSDN